MFETGSEARVAGWRFRSVFVVELLKAAPSAYLSSTFNADTALKAGL